MKILRKLKRNVLWHIINLTGLSIAFITALLVITFVNKELSYDNFHSKSDRIYRITTESFSSAGSMHPARVAGELSQNLTELLPEVESLLRILPFKRALIEINQNRFYSNHAFSCDSTFFDFFDFKLISGTPDALDQPYKVFISKSLAEKYFGSTDVVGKIIKVKHQQVPDALEYTVAGIMQDFPENSHFHAEILCSFTEYDNKTSWAYSYMMLGKDVNAEALEKKINDLISEDRPAGANKMLVHLQNIRDIHLHSHKEREMEANGDIKSIYLMLGGLIVILLIALTNYINLSRVQFIANIKISHIKRINGAGRFNLIMDNMAESLILSFCSVLLGLFLSVKLSGLFGLNPDFALWAVLSIAFILLIILSGIIPLLFLWPKMNELSALKGKLSYSFPLFFQFLLAIIAISISLNMSLQMSDLYNKHPKAKESGLLVLPANQWNAVQRFGLLKTELLKSPYVKNVSAAMEEPGGDILDGINIELEGLSDQDFAINLFTTDTNFFQFMDIQPIAGELYTGTTPSAEWEQKAIQLGNLEAMGHEDTEMYKTLKDDFVEHTDHFILNESAVKMLGFKNPEEAIGKRIITHHHMKYIFPSGIVVAVVPDFHYTNLHNEEEPLLTMYRKTFNYCFLIECKKEMVGPVISDLEKLWKEINPEFPLEYELISDSYQKIYLPEMSQLRVMTVLSLISIILAALGIVAMTIFNLQRRIKEIGIRKVNGAKTIEIVRMLNTETLRWVLISGIVAIPVAITIVNKWLENFAYKISIPWWTFALAILFCLIVSACIVNLISIRIANRNPVESLRYE